MRFGSILCNILAHLFRAGPRFGFSLAFALLRASTCACASWALYAWKPVMFKITQGEEKEDAKHRECGGNLLFDQKFYCLVPWIHIFFCKSGIEGNREVRSAIFTLHFKRVFVVGTGGNPLVSCIHPTKVMTHASKCCCVRLRPRFLQSLQVQMSKTHALCHGKGTHGQVSISIFSLLPTCAIAGPTKTNYNNVRLGLGTKLALQTCSLFTSGSWWRISSNMLA